MASKFAELYHYCQTLKPKISRRDIEKKVIELTGAKVRAVKSGLDIKVCRGFFVSANNKEHPLVKQMGVNLIVIARGLEYPWERFVHVKELMHLFDETAQLTGTPQLFEKLLTDFGQPSVDTSPQWQAEARAFWMALACFCPESIRKEFQEQLGKGHMDNYSIALQLQIPEQIVPALFVPAYPKTIEKLIA